VKARSKWQVCYYTVATINLLRWKNFVLKLLYFTFSVCIDVVLKGNVLVSTSP